MRTVTWIAGGLLLAASAWAGDPLEYRTLAADPRAYRGKQVRFQFPFTRVQPSVNPALARRGINDKGWVEVQTPWRPPAQGGSLLLLAPRKPEALVAALRATKPRTTIWLEGKLLHLTGDQGAQFYYVALSGMSPVKRKEPPEKKRETEKSVRYAPVTLAELQKNPAKHQGKPIALVVKNQPTRPLGKLLARLLKLDPQKYRMLPVARGFLALVDVEDKATLKHLAAVKPDQPVRIEGFFKRVGQGQRALALLKVDRASAPPKGQK